MNTNAQQRVKTFYLILKLMHGTGARNYAKEKNIEIKYVFL